MNTHLANHFRRQSEDARAFVPSRAPRKCSCCGQPGEFDLLRAAFDARHMDALAQHFGNEVCTDCADIFHPCAECGEVVDRLEASTGTHPDGGYLCGTCDDMINWTSLPYGSGRR